MSCSVDGCHKPVDRDGVCFRHRVASVGITLRGGAIVGNRGWNITKGDYMREHYGVTHDKELLRERKDIERA